LHELSSIIYVRNRTALPGVLMALWHLGEQVAAVRPVPFSGDAVVFELRDGRVRTKQATSRDLFMLLIRLMACHCVGLRCIARIELR
jgi:hypothetical protein